MVVTRGRAELSDHLPEVIDVLRVGNPLERSNVLRTAAVPETRAPALPRPVPQGAVVDAMFIACPPAGSHWEAQLLENGVWHYHHKHSPSPDKEALFVVTIRLPVGARLLAADPEPQRFSTRTGRVSMTWRVMTEIIKGNPATDEKWQFEAHIDYTLGAAGSAPPPVPGAGKSKEVRLNPKT